MPKVLGSVAARVAEAVWKKPMPGGWKLILLPVEEYCLSDLFSLKKQKKMRVRHVAFQAFLVLKKKIVSVGTMDEDGEWTKGPAEECRKKVGAMKWESAAAEMSGYLVMRRVMGS